MKASGDGVGRDLGPTFLLGSRLSAQKGRRGGRMVMLRGLEWEEDPRQPLSIKDQWLFDG